MDRLKLLSVIIESFNLEVSRVVKRERLFAGCTMCVSIWCLWMERNVGIFIDNSLILPQLWDRVFFLAALWCSANGYSRVVSFVGHMQGDW